ncbi:MAG: hypothetical protein HYZ15_15110 [Sphingobacteriales bacterium]|nr:hypothetical protein [Sphingobacteriales bacterium]
MKRFVTILMGAFMLSQSCFAKGNNVYIVYYATFKGKTGHAGIALDKYKVVYREVQEPGGVKQVADTIATGELVYYDLWPDDDFFNVRNTGKNIPALYYKLPVSASEEITLNSLFDKGIPHREHYPSDGLLRIRTSWQQDQQLIRLLDSMVIANRPFNARLFNCTDFVRIAIEQLLNVELRSKEFILAGWSTTPNKFYRALRKLKEVEVIKNADDKASCSFIRHRVLYKFFHRS